MRVTRLQYRAGSGPGEEPLEVEPATVMVLVGPNNSGKSLALREIETWCSSAERDRKVIDSIEVEFPTDVEATTSRMEPFIAWSDVGKVVERNPDGPVEFMDWNCGMHRPSLGPGQPVQTDRIFENQIQRNLEGLSGGTAEMYGMYEGNLRSCRTRWHVIRLDGRRRYELTDPMEGGDLTEPAANHLLARAQDGAAREVVRGLTCQAFRLHFVLDFMKVGHERGQPCWRSCGGGRIGSVGDAISGHGLVSFGRAAADVMRDGSRFRASFSDVGRRWPYRASH